MIDTFSRTFYLTGDALAQHPRYIDDEGGTRSSKTFSAIQWLAILAKQDTVPTLTSVVSESLPHLKRGAIRDFKYIMADEWEEDWWNASDNIYNFPSGSQMEFFSADNPGKVHGPGRHRLLINEGNRIPWETARQLFTRTSDFIIVDYNPAGEFWMHTHIAGRPNCVKVHSTYLDNCDPRTGKSYLTPSQIAEIESYKDDENWWRVYGLGELGRLEGLIFPDFELIDELPDNGYDVEVYGMDFGYTNDPSVLVRLRINLAARRIWAQQVFYATHLLNDDMARLMTEAGVPRSALIFADCAEPKTIADLQRRGFTVLPCDKGRRKAEQLQLMKGYHLAVTKDSVEGIKELRGYTWAKDKDGKLLNEPIGINDHWIDAGRYGFITYLSRYGGGGWSFGFAG